MSKIVIISGSPSHPSRSAAIADYLEKKIERAGLHVNKIIVRDLPAEDLAFANFNSPEIKDVQLEIEQAKAIIVVSPVYKASYPGLLKSFLDIIPEKGLENKIVLPIVTGGTIAHLLSIEYSFKPVFSVLGSNTIFNGVYLIDSQIGYKESGLTFAENEIENRLADAVERLISHLKSEKTVSRG